MGGIIHPQQSCQVKYKADIPKKYSGHPPLHHKNSNEELPPQSLSHRLARTNHDKQNANRHAAYQWIQRPEDEPHLKGYPQKHLDKHGVAAHSYHGAAVDEEVPRADVFVKRHNGCYYRPGNSRHREAKA